MSLRDVGAGGGFPTTGDLTTLEVHLSGGAAIGNPEVPGLTPNLDCDGDGLERVVLDSVRHIAECVDGDGTTIEGRDCWQDERMADGFSLGLSLSFTSARLAGPLPGWQVASGAECANPIESSPLWGACDELEHVVCVGGMTRACASECVLDGEETCRPDCLGWGPCLGAGSSRVSFDDCDDLARSGFDGQWVESRVETHAACSTETLAVQLCSTTWQMRGVSFAQPLTVGGGGISVEAFLQAGTAEPSQWNPADGWAVVVYVGAGGDWLDGDSLGDRLGLNHHRPGYSLEWRFLTFGLETQDERDADWLSLRVMEGEGAAPRDLCSFGECPDAPSPSLDRDAEYPVRQGLRLSIVPDAPETELNEQYVYGEMATPDGEWVWDGLLCFGDGCEVRVLPGDTVYAGVASATGSQAADLTLRAGDLAVEIRSPCD